ncbi:MAG: hypothetical protein AseanaTS_03530 [Candidatus Pelagadaptatus aseana]|uniref:hypothetical protein n=1 Tax=Candidatus Pelagadaptatus aseana TaxID=3120508 RepID=UPI0039B2ABD6
MTVKKHLQLLAYSFITWLTFYLIGLPEYYQQWPLWAKLVVVPVVTALYFPVARFSLNHYWDDGNHRVNARWLALYLTVPLFVYDYLLLAVYKGIGIYFVIPYWYLTFFYFSFWIQFPYVARQMERETLVVAEPE